MYTKEEGLFSFLRVHGRRVKNYFENGGNPEYYASSADWMPRNLERRVEILFPVESEVLRKKLWHILDLELKDTEKAHIMNSDGIYVKPDVKGDDTEKINSQLIFGQEASKNSLSPVMPTQLRIML